MTEKEKKRVAPVAKKTAFEWAKSLGHFTAKEANRPESMALYSPAFEAANVIYGWSLQAHHFQAEPFLLSEFDFVEALKAALEFPVVAPHGPAVAPYLGDKYKTFKPSKASAKE